MLHRALAQFGVWGWTSSRASSPLECCSGELRSVNPAGTSSADALPPACSPGPSSRRLVSESKSSTSLKGVNLTDVLLACGAHVLKVPHTFFVRPGTGGVYTRWNSPTPGTKKEPTFSSSLWKTIARVFIMSVDWLKVAPDVSASFVFNCVGFKHTLPCDRHTCVSVFPLRMSFFPILPPLQGLGRRGNEKLNEWLEPRMATDGEWPKAAKGSQITRMTHQAWADLATRPLCTTVGPLVGVICVLFACMVSFVWATSLASRANGEHLPRRLRGEGRVAFIHFV